MSQRPTLAFVGAGMMGQLAHLANYAQLRDASECEIAGIIDLKPRLAEAVAARYRVPNVYDTLDELLADPGVDAVVCIQQWPNNYPLVKRILAAGKSAITEKPMVGRLDEAEELVALARQQGLLYAVGFMKRYDLGVELAKKLLIQFHTSDEFGPLLTVDTVCNGGDWLHNIGASIQTDEPLPGTPPPPTYPDACRSPQQRAAYGYLLNIFSHNINLCHHLLDAQLQPQSAQFRGDRAFNATARCGATLVTVRGAVSSAHEWHEWTTLTFAEGELRVKTPTPMNRQRSAEVTLLRKTTQGHTTTHYHVPVGWAFFRQAQGFVRALTGAEPLRAPAEQCLWDVRVMQRLIELAEIV